MLEELLLRCVLVTRTTDETERVDAPRSYSYILFGKPLPAPIRKPAATVSLQRLVDEDLAEASCVLFFQGMDCHLVDAEDCQDAVRGKQRVEGVARRSKPYNDAFEYGKTREQLDIALYRLR